MAPNNHDLERLTPASAGVGPVRQNSTSSYPTRESRGLAENSRSKRNQIQFDNVPESQFLKGFDDQYLIAGHIQITA